MLDIKIYASGSSGNCYTVTDGKTTIMLDCGLPFRQILRLTKFRVPDAVFVTHEHKDHAMAVKDFLRRGVDVYMTFGTMKALQLSRQEHRLHIIRPENETAVVGDIYITPFDTQHDAEQPCGFFLEDADDRVLYATDTFYIRQRFDGITKMMLEVNYSTDIIRENTVAGVLNPALEKRLTTSHMSLENALEFLEANDLRHLKEIWLIHMSRNNANPWAFKKAIMEATGKPVYIVV